MTTAATPAQLRSALADLAGRCRACLQCGRCRSACPLGSELAGGPRTVILMALAGEVGGLLGCDAVWRCSGCGACTRACPAGVDVAAVMAQVRDLQREAGGVRCPERSAAQIAAEQIRRRRGVDGLRVGLGLAARGFLPRDPVGAAGLGMRSLLRGTRLPGDGRPGVGPPAPWPRREPGTGAESAEARALFPGCAVRADRRAHSATRSLAAAAGLRLIEPATPLCCGHPSRGAALPPPPPDWPVLTACPACERALARAGAAATPIWEVVVARARSGTLRLHARSARVVPFAGCLSERGPALAVMAEAAELAGCEPLIDRPSLHGACCGGLGGLYRAPAVSIVELLRFAASRGAPVATPCLLCRDVVRSAARRSRAPVPVHFWPEFFRPAPPRLHADPAAVAVPAPASRSEAVR